jgi:hypothetical protein
MIKERGEDGEGEVRRIKRRKSDDQIVSSEGGLAVDP